MSQFAIVVAGEAEQARAVRLEANAHELDLYGADGSLERVPWWRLYRLEETSTAHRFRRVDKRNWELRVTAGSDGALLAHVGRRPLHRLVHPLRRLEVLKVGIGAVVLFVTVAQHAPAEWLAKSVPEWAQHRLVDNTVAMEAPVRCSYPGGAAAVRKLLVRLDPDVGSRVDIVAVKEPGFVVTSVPGEKIYMYLGSLNEIDQGALPALLAHELSHIRHGDPIVAAIRHSGWLGTWAAVLQGGNRKLGLQFSGVEERRADLEAMRMMRNAKIPLLPAAKMFNQMRVSKEQGGFFGYDQRDFHFGIDARAQRWAAAARSDAANPPPLLSPDESDALFNFCWEGRIAPLPSEQRVSFSRASGSGEIGLPESVKHH